MEVILCWATTESRFWFEAVDDVTNKDLNDIENEECESKTLDRCLGEYKNAFSSFVLSYRVRVGEVRTATVGNNRDSKRPTDDDDGTGD